MTLVCGLCCVDVCGVVLCDLGVWSVLCCVWSVLCCVTWVCGLCCVVLCDLGVWSVLCRCVWCCGYGIQSHSHVTSF